MSKKPIRLKCQGGIEFNDFVANALFVVSDDFEFIHSENNPDFIVFGPYGDDIPSPGNYQRIGYFCECMWPDLSKCEWGFGVLNESEDGDRKYKRIEWHGVNPEYLVKRNDPNKGITIPNKFCNFIFSNSVPYREYFFTQLGKYKKIDAPGKSMNNMESFDSLYPELDFWERKRKFLSQYKFTIAFENYSHPGYHTEKLTDPMLSGSVPVYLGDPFVGDFFNSKSFINTHEIFGINNSLGNSYMRHFALQKLRERRFISYPGIIDKVYRKSKQEIRNFRMNYLFKRHFDSIIERIVEIDKNDSSYIDILRAPFFKNNTAPSIDAMRNHWKFVFSS